MQNERKYSMNGNNNQRYSYHFPFFVCPLNESITINTSRKEIIFFLFILYISFASPPHRHLNFVATFSVARYYTYITFIHYLHMEIFGGFCHHSKW